ncbi:hypothetical protein GCK32_022259, partial [Trichostrongylus colubriformis]
RKASLRFLVQQQSLHDVKLRRRRRWMAAISDLIRKMN